jgi:adenylate cyclase
VQGSFKSIQEAPSEDSIIWVCHVDNIESDVLSVRIFGGAEGHRKCDNPDWFDSFPAKAVEGL